MAERRKAVRAVSKIEVFEGGPKGRVPLYVTGNISTTGMFLITHDPLPAGTGFKIRFSLPDSDEIIEAMGQVVWMRREKEGSDRQPGMGLRFTEIRENDRSRIRRFVYSASELEEEV